MSKRLGRIIGCKYKTASWNLIEFPDGSNIGSTVSRRGETHRDTVHLKKLSSPPTKPGSVGFPTDQGSLRHETHDLLLFLAFSV